MLNTLATFALLGGGMWVSTTLIPGQWPLIIALGAVAGLLILWVGSLLSRSAPLAQAQPNSVGGSRRDGKSLFGVACIIAAMALGMMWLVLRDGSMAALPVGIASTAVFLPGACLGIAAYLMILAWKPAR